MVIVSKQSNRNIIKVLDSEVAFFERFTKKYAINWSVEEKKDGLLSISNSYVGYIVTPSRKIDLLPKYNEIGFEHIFRIYLYVNSYNKTDDTSILDVTDSNSDIDVADLFFSTLSMNVRQGIHRNYRKTQKNIETLKGKIEFPITLKNYLLNKRNYVATDVSVLSLDNPINQIIVTALNKLSKISKYASKSSSFLMYFEGVNGNINNGKEHLRKITFNSNTMRFKQVLTYASMIIDQMDYDTIGNMIGTESFIVNFDRLFEDFVAKILLTVPEKRDFSVWSKPEIFSEIQRFNSSIEYREYLPDILYKYNREDKEKNYEPTAYAVLDVKNKAYSSYKNADIYQIVTYSKLLYASKMLLLYPSFERKKSEVLELNSEIFSPNIIFACFINISESDGKEFLQSIADFAKEVLQIVQN